MIRGIYTLGNDVVYDQVVALLNSIDENCGSDIPVFVVAYDNNIEKIKIEISKRKNVEILDDPNLFKPWEDFSYEVWKAHPDALESWQKQGIKGVRRLAMNRRYCAFDSNAPLEKFAYFDADVLLFNSLDVVFKALDERDFVVYDFQYKDPTHIYNVQSTKLFEVFSESRIRSEIFCAGFYASHRGFFSPEKREWLIEQLKNGEAEILYTGAPNQSVLNYITMRSEIPVYNLSLNLSPDRVTGCTVTSPHFETRDNLLYDKGVRLTYLHYIGLSSSLFTRLCEGENIDFPYRDIFLHYRYLHEPEKRPRFTGKPIPHNPPRSLQTKILNKLGFK